MKKYLFISALLTILTVSIFFGIFYYQENQPQEVIIKVNPEEQPALNYKSYIKIFLYQILGHKKIIMKQIFLPVKMEESLFIIKNFIKQQVVKGS